TDVTDEQARWRDDAVMRSNSVSLVERRVGMGVGTGHRTKLKTWLARLPLDAKHKNEWRYLHAELFLERGRQKQTQSIINKITFRPNQNPLHIGGPPLIK
ncbi:murein transglycosylase, partial [Enterobacter intestinihominis]